MATLRILDSITDRGNPRRDNEDSFGGNRHCAFVIDGATGLGGDFLDMGMSDAAWLAGFARDLFEEHVGKYRSVAEVVRLVNGRVGSLVGEMLGDRVLPAWCMPVAGFQAIVVQDGHLTTAGLGDCRLFAVDRNGTAFDTTALPRSQADERSGAELALSLLSGEALTASLSDHPDVRDELRRRRALYNQPGGEVWTLGVAPEAGHHVSRIAMPLQPPLRGLLCTDGFAALVDLYGRHDTGSLVQAAADKGLVPLLAELRHIEHREDPDRQRYPRFKVSDDATAVLFEIV